jgi:multiple sugar transport system substrate-binding protein
LIVITDKLKRSFYFVDMPVELCFYVNEPWFISMNQVLGGNNAIAQIEGELIILKKLFVKSLVLTSLLLTSLVVVAPQGNAADPKNNVACAKVAKKATSGQTAFICTKVGSKLVWKKVKNTAPAVKPSGTLNVAHWDFLAPTYGKDMQAVIKSYEKYNPNAKIETVGIVRSVYETKMKIQLSAKGGPDVFTIPDTFFPELARSNLLESLDNVFPAATRKTMNESNNGGIWRGKQLAITWQVAPYAFFWNKDILDKAGVKPPTTPAELVAAAKTIKEKTGLTGFAVRSRLAEETPWWIDFNNWVVGFNGGWSNGEKLTIDSPQNIAAVTAYKDVYDSGGFSVGDDASTFRSKFGQGLVGMMIDATGALPAMIGTKVPSKTVGASKLPFPGKSTSQVGILFGINANSKNKELAKDFLNWFLIKDTQQAISEMIGNTSTVATETTVPAAFLSDNPWAAAYKENGKSTKSSVPEGFESSTSEIRKEVLTQLEQVLLGKLTPAEALKKAQENLS